MNGHCIIIAPTLNKEGRPRRCSQGPLFDAMYGGQVIVVGSTEPCLDAARVLKAKGLTGRLEMGDTVLPYCRFRADIDKAAGLTVREGDEPPRLVKFKSFAPRNAPDGDFISGGMPVAQTGASRPAAYPHRLPGQQEGWAE